MVERERGNCQMQMVMLPSSRTFLDCETSSLEEGWRSHDPLGPSSPPCLLGKGAWYSQNGPSFPLMMNFDLACPAEDWVIQRWWRPGWSGNSSPPLMNHTPLARFPL